MLGLRDVLVVTPAATFHHHHHHDALLHQPDNNLLDDSHRGKAAAGIQFWQAQPPSAAAPQTQQQFHNPNPNPNLGYLKKPVQMADSNSGYATCQDCGNQAKKDCIHRRCRTCCKSRGFDCTTHVKSTWVPAARRRERQQFSATAAAAAGSSTSTSAPKKQRLIGSQTTTTSTSTPRSHDATSSHQDAGFREGLPGHVRAPAVFKCVKVTSMEDGEDEYAYQAMVRIGGHTFKGFLYDQGLDNGQGGEDHTHITGTGDGHNAIPNISELHLGGAQQTDAYGVPGGFLGGTSYGNQ